MSNHAGIAAPTLIYVLIDQRSEFDMIDRPATDPGESREHGGHVIYKTVEQDGCRVVFQFWIKDPIAKQYIATKEK